MSDFPELALKPLSPADAQEAETLVREAGWNQTSADWRLMIENGDAVGFFTAQGPSRRLIATALSLPFGAEFAWISMVLVARQWRRRGLASALLKDRIGAIRARGMVPVLDATEAGRQVYLRLGFQDIYRLSRFSGEAPSLPPMPPLSVPLRPMNEADLGSVIAWDAEQFGADRGAVLRALHRRAPELAWRAVGSDGAMAGYSLGREGRVAMQVGPLLANDGVIAEALATAAIGRIEGPFFIDVCDRHEAMVDWLGRIGLRRQRGFVRMAYGRDRLFDNPAAIFAIAGPELG
jgi:GNAT superfamily N-acetyltransferase